MAQGSFTMSHSLVGADRGTHVKIMLLSAACAVAFTAVLFGSQMQAGNATQAASQGVVKASKPTAVTTRDNVTFIR